MAKVTYRRGPAIGEGVLVQGLDVEVPHLTAIHDLNAPGEVVSIDWQRETFVVELAHGVRSLALSVEVPLGEYGRKVIGRWECGHGNESMRCFLTAEHVGPHLYKPTHE